MNIDENTTSGGDDGLLRDPQQDRADDWIDLETLKRRVEAGLAFAVDRTPLTAEQRAIADANEGLAIWWARRRWRRAKRAGMDFDEIVVACRLGVEDAAARFDPGRGAKFAAFAGGYILRRISRMHRVADEDDEGSESGTRPAKTRRQPRGLSGEFARLCDPMFLATLRLAVRRGTGQFDADDVTLLFRRAVKGLSQADLAVKEGVSVQTIRRRERRAAALIGPYMAGLDAAFREGPAGGWMSPSADAMDGYRERHEARANYGRDPSRRMD